MEFYFPSQTDANEVSKSGAGNNTGLTIET